MAITMREGRSQADIEAAERILGIKRMPDLAAMPDSAARLRDAELAAEWAAERAAAELDAASAGVFRNGKSPELRAPDKRDSRGFREWTVKSTSNPELAYAVIERWDTKSGTGTYFYCTCPSWATQRGRGTDCKHIRQVIG